MNPTGVLTLLVGLGVGGFGVVRWRQIRALRRTGVRSVGTVVGHEQSADDGSVYSPVITFVDAAGRPRRFTADLWVSWRVHPVGEEVPVRYPPGRPYAAQLGSTTHDALTVGVPLAVGALSQLSGCSGFSTGEGASRSPQRGSGSLPWRWTLIQSSTSFRFQILPWVSFATGLGKSGRRASW